MSEENEEKRINCSFCDKTNLMVKKMICGSSAAICNECIELCNDIIEDELKEKEK